MTIAIETSSYHRIGIKARVSDPSANKILQTIREFLHLQIASLEIIHIYTVHKEMLTEQFREMAEALFVDPVIQEIVDEEEACDWIVEVSLKPGVTDNAASTAKLTICDYLGETSVSVSTSTRYLIKGPLFHKDVERIALELLGNPLIEDITITNGMGAVTLIDLVISDEELLNISKQRQLALSLKEMQAIRNHFKNRKITDVELEAIAQTWSEHCKHKIFNAKILYENEIIDSLFSTYIKAATKKINKDWLVSVFTDNAGIIRFDDQNNLAFKVETHNSPSALDPYGGALTGILGVNRDIMGAGIGARLIANTDVFCFAPPNYNKTLPPRLHHPKRVFEGVRLGVEHGGNKSGVPTVNGSIFFDERYLGKPIVYCGSIGIMPKEIDGKPTHLKEIIPGDFIVIAGGRTGRDGIHGATFSSEELHAGSPSSAVQIGDPFTQKKLHDFILDARDKILYRTLTDNGAGGFSSSIGELAQISGGCEIHLDQALLKHPRLLPWEILLSESQERMTLAVPPECWKNLQELAAFHEVEIVCIGTFTDTGNFIVYHNGKQVANLTLEFLHHGLPQMELKAEWNPKSESPIKIDCSLKETLHQLLRSYNICSKESVVRQYDHEVQGATVLKPMVGINHDGPSNAAVLAPLGSKKGIVVSHGMCPRYSDFDTYHMAACAVDEAIRNAVSVGANPDHIAILDNFCWPDPIEHPEKNKDGKHKLAQLVRACQGLYDTACAYGTPIISGKDSMKNDYIINGIKISIPPTLLISAMGVIDDITHCVSMDVKCPGDIIYIVGQTKNELGGSELSPNQGCVPKVVCALETYRRVYQAMQKDLVASCHDCSDGGLGVALAEIAFAGGYGIEVDIEKINGNLTDVERLFSESPCRLIITVDPKKAVAFESIVKATRIGTVRQDKRFIIQGKFEDDIDILKASWQGGL